MSKPPPGYRFLSLSGFIVVILIGWHLLPTEAAHAADSAPWYSSDIGAHFKAAEAISKSRPSSPSDADIAHRLARGLIEDPPGFHSPDAALWVGSIRVSIEDGHGNNLDLSTYPGDAIKYYLNSLATFANLPITITARGNHDNNMSIVVADGGAIDGTAGAIYGVPGLTTKVAMSGLLRSGDRGSNRLVEKNVIKACVVARPMSSNAKLRDFFQCSFWHELSAAIGGCLMPRGSITLVPDTCNGIDNWGDGNLFYNLRLYYNSGLAPGMDVTLVEQKIADHLKELSNVK